MFEIAIHIAIGLIVGCACGSLPPIIARWAAKKDLSFIKRILGIKSPTKHMQGVRECDPSRGLTFIKSELPHGNKCHFCPRGDCKARVEWCFREVPVCDNCLKEIRK